MKPYCAATVAARNVIKDKAANAKTPPRTAFALRMSDPSQLEIRNTLRPNKAHPKPLASLPNDHAKPLTKDNCPAGQHRHTKRATAYTIPAQTRDEASQHDAVPG